MRRRTRSESTWGRPSRTSAAFLTASASFVRSSSVCPTRAVPALTAASASARRSASAGATSTSTRGLHVRQQLSRRRVPKQLKTPAAQLSLHSLRHTFASLLIAKGLDVVFVSRQLGHASPATTLGVYAHLFDQVQHAATARAALEESYQTMTGTQPREPRGPASRSVVALLVAGESGPVAR